MLGRRLQGHQVYDVNHANLQVRQVLRRRSTAASVSRVGTSPQQAITTSGSPPLSLLAHSQMPMPGGAMFDRGLHIEPLRRGLLAGHDHVDVVAAAQAMIGHESRVLASGGR